MKDLQEKQLCSGAFGRMYELSRGLKPIPTTLFKVFVRRYSVTLYGTIRGPT